ncbi:MAG: YihY/virulence factor BrkB family protein [Microbacterium hominis]|jgi:membrane protein|uniref:YihY/virulence factor BrkB family protein n=1 Tax=Microbacterium TaxID=33882 RepID=UPI001995DCE9|nr:MULTISPECIES: YihY/virulence factor BrkB family protein [Microbacterium]MBD3758856.1 YihY/virulence factor BrkB family protein [Microbacterium sp.]MBZ6372239.1 YihY/virulence factor BrkB family protein [Microbacterium hominis]
MDIARVIAWALSLTPVRAFLRYSERRGSMLADSVTYRTLFSVFAGVLLGFSAAALFLAGNPQAWQALIDAVNNAVPGLVGEDGLIKVSAIDAPAGVTVAGVIAVIGLVGAAIGAIGSLRNAMRTICDQTHDDVPFWLVMLRNLALAVGVGGALLASAVATMLGTAGLGIVAGWLGLAEGDPAVEWGSRFLALGVTFVLDAVAVAVLFRMLSGVRPAAKSLWIGALLGAVGLTVLQQLSGLFVGGATSNPLLATFASLIALLLWINLSAQVILIATSFIYTLDVENADRVRTRFGATTFAQRRVRQAENAVALASAELNAARTAEAEEREAAREQEAKKQGADT